MTIFTILILPILNHRKSFHFLRSSLISFFSNLKFLSYRSFTCLVRVTSKYFILFVTIVNDVVYLISYSASLYFEYRNATDLLQLISYLSTLLKLYIRFRSTLVEFLVSLNHMIIASTHSDILISSSSIWIPLTTLC